MTDTQFCLPSPRILAYLSHAQGLPIFFHLWSFTWLLLFFTSALQLSCSWRNLFLCFDSRRLEDFLWLDGPTKLANWSPALIETLHGWHFNLLLVEEKKIVAEEKEVQPIINPLSLLLSLSYKFPSMPSTVAFLPHGI